MKDFSKLKEALGGILDEAREKKKLEDAQRTEKNEADRRAIFESVGKDIGTVIGPYIEKLKENSSMSAQELKRIISEAVKVDVPSIDTAGMEAVLAGAFANFQIPTPQVNVRVPDIHVPAPVVDKVKILNWPDRMKMLLDGIDLKHPLPVLVVDELGKPYYGGGTSGGSGGGGPRPVMDMQDARGVSLVDSTTDPAKPVLRTSATVTFPTSSISAALVDSSGVQYSGSNPLPVAFTPSSSQNVLVQDGQGSLITSHVSGDFKGLDVNLIGATGSVAAALVDSSGVAYSGSNPLPTTATLSTPQGPGDGATAMRVILAGDSVGSVMVNNPQGLGDAATALRVLIAGNSDASVVVNNPQGPGDSATALRVLIAGNSDASVVVNNPQGPGDAATALRVLIAGNSDTSVVVNNPQGQGDSATALRILQAGDAVASVFVTGYADSIMVYQARTTAPTAKSDGADVRPTADKVGRPITRPMQMRDLISTAYVTLSTGTEATLLAAVAGKFLDLVYIMGANTSTAAVQIDIRAVTAGNVVASLYIPGNSTAGVSFPVPFPQDNQGNNWTVDMPDITNSNVLISALFSQEI